MGDSAIHMKHLFKQYNISVPHGYENTPDHLTLLLEFLAFLHEGDNTLTILQFISDHLDWLQTFIDELKEVANSSFYVYVTIVFDEFLKAYYLDM
ncbi:hypothetical protein BKP37_01375 [Anaerobacillus alkalilacustris]|uniref:Nitrate reductase delta subunit n=2 Tax=Anaerobacillus alkalilacustris TaxID=393763 RepID=A0A1S2LY98_9BACI|nr:hypothetical protein BKP37_01375 [Anaerobacillus alkalilacustris]